MNRNLDKAELGIKSVIGIVGGAVALVGFFYTQVVIPIKDVQARILSIEVSLQKEQVKYDELNSKVSDVDKKIDNHIIQTKKI